MGRKLIWDAEAKNLLNNVSIDYNASPYRLKDREFVHCVGLLDVVTRERFRFNQREVYTHFKQFIMDEDIDEMIGHNTINYDHMLMKAAIGLDYSIGVDGELDTVGGKNIIITDTLIMSKTLNPDRPQHSIDYFGRLLGLEKIDWRAKAIELGIIQAGDPRGAEFRVYHEEMGIYMDRDIDVNERVWRWLLKEWGDWNWNRPYETEKAVAEIITRQEHRGFWFDRDQAVENVKELDIKMEGLRATVEPLIPPKPLTKGDLADLTPTTKQFKKNGEPITHILNFAKKHGSEFVEVDGVWTAVLYGERYTLPMAPEPLYTTAPAKITDTQHIKEWLVEMGWKPTQYKERDLSVDSKKKKITKEKFDLAVEKWVEQTFASPFKRDRLEMLEYSIRVDKGLLLTKLKKHEHMKRPLMVYTNPTLTIGMEKEIDPELLKLTEQFAYAKEISEYLTFRHRRNSILGGGVDPDDDEDMQKGWMSVDRINDDHRIPTPADTCGAATSRFKHRSVANVPRVTSPYGKEMRALFGVDVGFYQMGYDFDSLEAKIESHYVYRYPGGPEYGVSLTAEKPNDCHTVLAKQISLLLGRPFPRGTAKNVKYGCSYNAQVKRVAKTVGCTLEEAQIIFDTFWEQAFPLKQLKEAMQQYWEGKGEKKFLLGVDGRKLPIRSKGNVINTAFQSAGVICAKKAMIYHDRMLKAEGLSIDFFLEDWKARPEFCQQLIAYHDEAQCEVTKGSVTFKKFATEDEAKAFKSDDGKVWSDVIHNDKGYFRAYNRAGELATIAVRMAGEYYKLNVELTAGYMIGTNWATCH
jgi:DNA polymerase I-like protein with 3'-5' exonuclease and polymerase domains